jgi:fucose permease
MVSYLIFHAGLGTAITPFVSSLIVERFDMAAALQFATICYLLTLVLILAARWLREIRTGEVDAAA